MSSRKRRIEVTGAGGPKKQRGDGGEVAKQRRRPHGLINQGATCYLNSVLQVLSVTPEIQSRLDSKSEVEQVMKMFFRKLREEACGTEDITALLGIENVHQQRDAAECLETLLRTVSRRASEVFRGELRDTTRCCEGHLIIQDTSPFWTLPLSLRDNNVDIYSVEQGFKKVFSPKVYSEDNLVFCKDCDKKMEATSRNQMVRFPPVLALLLKRFELDYVTMATVKSSRSVDVPSALSTEGRRYELYGVVDHLGSTAGGHYTATVRSRDDNTWYTCNDSHVTKEQNQPFDQNGTFSSRTAYLLMYRESSGDEVKKEVNAEREVLLSPDRQEGSRRRRPVCLLFIIGLVVVVVGLIVVVLLTTLSSY